jgi:hypothetical protein
VANDQSAISLEAPKMPEPDLAREVASLLKFVEPQLRYRNAPIASENNAWPLWQQAVDEYVDQPTDDEFQEGLERFLDSPAQISDALRHRISEWVGQNEACHKLTDEGIARGALESLRATRSVQLSLAMDDNRVIRKLAVVKQIASGQQLGQHDSASALREAISILKMGTMLVRAEGLVVDSFVAQSVLGIGQYAAYRVATNDGASDEQAARAIAELAAAKATKADNKQTHRVEFCRWFIPSVAQLPLKADCLTLAKGYVIGGLVSDFKPSVKVFQEYQRSIRQTAALLEDHPNPLDKVATIRLASDALLRFFDDLDKPRLQRGGKWFESLRKELTAWPAEVAPDMWVVTGLGDNLGSNPIPRRKLTDRDLKRARKQLHAVDNVLGKQMIVERFSIMASPILDMSQVRLESARIRIAIRIYEKRHGHLPEQLGALVDDRLLPEVPRDPYDGHLFRYSAERRVIWSVGQEGINAGIVPNQEDPQNPFFEDIEFTWKVGRLQESAVRITRH